MDYKEVKKVIEAKYDRKNWQKLLHDIFKGKVEFWAQPQKVSVDKTMAKEAFYTGKISLSDRKTIAIYEVELSDNVNIERNRAGIRNLLCSQWRGMGCTGAFMFCFRQNESILRFSYVSEALNFAQDGALVREGTDTKRFTYLLGEGHRSRTAISRFEELKNSTQQDLQAITKAFSVEALSDRFFTEYKKQYEDIVEFITEQSGQDIMEEFKNFPDPAKAVRDYVKKLMGRLVFIQFLQKKGWMGCTGPDWTNGDREFVQNLFANTTYQDTFVDDVLEPLFNDINTKRKDDLVSDECVGTGIKVPYLNGGLFEKDEYDRVNFPLPANYIKNLLDFFASYNFTIDENDPDDAEIGVDPEMLGRIFENLLEDNKDKGAFYTPKEVVQYMCRESLIAYLQTGIDDDATKNVLRQFVTIHDANALADDLKKSIDQKLKDVKICDPAIGSGAFPMGLLHELYACRKAIEGFDAETAVSIKTQIIQNNIYGVDIEKGAVDIARLRFWLALVVDEKTPHALPNMDFKIMQGNSLLEQYEGVDLSGMSLSEQAQKKAKKGEQWQPILAFDEGEALENIQHAVKEYYLTDDHTKKLSLREIINHNIRSYILSLKGFSTELKAQLEKLPIPNDQFFLWHIYFKEVFDEDGFDIVIGNPPYVSTKGRSTENASLLKSAYGFADDLYYHFIILGYGLLKSNGIQTMITSDTYFTTLTKAGLRDELQKNTLLQLVHWGHDVFDSAMVSTATFISQKRKPNKIDFVQIYDVKGKKSFREGISYRISQDVFKKSINSAIFIPSQLNLQIDKLFAKQHAELLNEWWPKIETSRKIAQNSISLSRYRNSLKTGTMTIIGLVTDGGQGLATANNGKYVGVLSHTKAAENIRISRRRKLDEFNLKNHTNYQLPVDELEIWKLFDDLKLKYGRDCFGQGYIFRIVPPSLVANASSLSEEEKRNGIDSEQTFVPYDKGDKDGNRWYLETPYLIDWSKENVKFLSRDPKARFQNTKFYFQEGFCYSDIKTFFIRCRLKGISVHDVKSMSLFPVCDKFPFYYIITVLNSHFAATVVYNFLNNTPSFQMNDCRMLPIMVPTEEQLKECKSLFDKAIKIQKDFFAQRISSDVRNKRLQEVQDSIDALIYKIYGIKNQEYLAHTNTVYSVAKQKADNLEQINILNLNSDEEM